MRATTRWLPAVLGLALLVGAPALASRPAPDVGTFDPAPSAEPDPSTPAQPDTAPAVGPPHTEPEPIRPADPRTLRIDAIGVDAPLVEVGLADDGTMEIPRDVSDVGWYRLGVSPGAAGTAVLSGHVDVRSQGRGALWDLSRLDLGALLEIEHDDGRTSRWRVVGRARYPKDDLPVETLFTRFGASRLAVITCDGAFDPRTRSYSHNVVVLAEPA
jgi:hypothetical protein